MNRLESMLFARRGALVMGWAILTALVGRPLRAGRLAWILVAAATFLRLWARLHIGRHARGRRAEAPYCATGGPYRFLSHPLYTANLLAMFAWVLCLRGLHPVVRWLPALGPAVLWGVLARAEENLMRKIAPAPRTSSPEPLLHTLRREIWSVGPWWVALWWISNPRFAQRFDRD